MAQLLIRESGTRDEPIREFELESSEVTVGRSLDCGLPLDNQTVSRRHASIARTEQGWSVTDLGSINGTWVNGEKVSRHLLHHQDSICFGSAVAIFDDPPDARATVEIDVESLLEAAHETAAIRAADHESGPPVTMAASTEQTWPETAARDVVESETPGAATEDPSVPSPSTSSSSAAQPPRDVGEKRLVRDQLGPAGEIPSGSPVDSGPSSRPVSRHYAGFWRRVLASLADAVILAVIGFLLTFALGLAGGLVAEPAPFLQEYVAAIATAVGFLLPVAYFLVGWAHWGRTPGKALCGLRILREDGAQLGMGGAFVRLLGYLLSSLVLGLGFLMAAFTDRKRGLHDMVAGTVVVREG
jgi:uncharacterized RDD family membrane protein YckC/pSer/pThr/pTyr-binding forkhead associated (FHA) protein